MKRGASWDTIQSYVWIGQMSWCWQIRGEQNWCLWSVAKRKTEHSKYRAFLILSCDKPRSHLQNDWLINRRSRHSIIITLLPKAWYKFENQWIYTKNSCCVQLSLVLRELVNLNCTEVPAVLLFLSCMAFSVYGLSWLVSRVVNKPKTQRACGRAWVHAGEKPLLEG